MALYLATGKNWIISVFHSTYDVILGTTASDKTYEAHFAIKISGPLFKLRISRWQQQSTGSC